ncbi:MAG: hypothetical protein RSB39_07940 [Oscillospiraceae bacterium]
MNGIEDKEQREANISKEQKRLTKLFASVEKSKLKVIAGLIERAAFMRITLDELEDDLNTYGFTESFSQGDQEPYQRKRPIAEIYSSMNANYQKIIKQMTDLLPKDVPKADTDDGFENFVNGRGND